MVLCPICNKEVKSLGINNHIDSGCVTFVLDNGMANSRTLLSPSGTQSAPRSSQKRPLSTFFQTPAAKRQAANDKTSTPVTHESTVKTNGLKRAYDEGPGHSSPTTETTAAKGLATEEVENAQINGNGTTAQQSGPVAKRTKTNKAAPLAERMRPQSLDEVHGQDLVGRDGVLRALIEADRVPSMILWGPSGTGKTTIARCIAQTVGSRFVELNATSSGVGECKRFFGEAASELALTGRKTIIFCDEIHRFSKSQQDVFLKPVEAGTMTLIGATTENPSFKVQSALLSRCRTFVLKSLCVEDVQEILIRALRHEVTDTGAELSPLIDHEMLTYLSAFADGDARTALNLLELALSLSSQGKPDGSALTKADIKESLTKTLVYDRAGDQHYDTISAFHKAVRGSDADAALYYLARMLQSGEDAVFIARRMVVIASEDVGLADNTMLPLAAAAMQAAQMIGMPEARIPLAHCAVALAQASKSVRVYRALGKAYSALQEPGVAGLPIPIHLRNATTRLARDMGYGAMYKYPPNYVGGNVKQEYLPEQIRTRRFLEDRNLGTETDPDLDMTGV